VLAVSAVQQPNSSSLLVLHGRYFAISHSVVAAAVERYWSNVTFAVILADGKYSSREMAADDGFALAEPKTVEKSRRRRRKQCQKTISVQSPPSWKIVDRNRFGFY
jgi:hypothetical protein